MTQNEKDYQFHVILWDIIESLNEDDEWWHTGHPLSAEEFFEDFLDTENGVVHSNLDWMIETGHNSEFVVGKIEEVRPIFEQARELGKRIFEIENKLETKPGFEFREEYPLDTTFKSGDYIIKWLYLDSNGELKLGGVKRGSDKKECVRFSENPGLTEEIVKNLESIFGLA